jgi:hypothetical protein
MTNQKILTKAIRKAKNNGWKTTLITSWPWSDEFLEWSDWEVRTSLYEVIFNHGFAKALWGQQKVYTVGNGEPLGPGYHALLHPLIPRWQFKIQQMVIAEDPIKYLGENI